ncbi:glycosyltransferase family 4 protein [Cognatitamlana onchidii]|uniref:glycosyltransferase family 4 protein n=1 Tax=Cognatitamlana onchidii TaxID=2562860 RepID=UPI0010A5FE95|nr:glycosyltransferase family 4 protein [Algibacter onchidii]
MTNLLYIGNKLSQKGKTKTTIETMGSLLEKEGFSVHISSSKQNKLIRLCDMLFSVVRHRNSVDYVLIDTYSTSNFYYAYLTSQLCRWFKLKYMPILHGGNLPKRLKGFPKMSVQIFENAFKNVAPSLYLYAHFKQAGFTNLEYIPNNIAIKNYVFKMRPIDEVKLLWVRSFSKFYNPQLAVRLLKALKDEGIKASLCMIGPDNDGSLSKTKELARALQVDVEFTGLLSKEDWHNKARDFNIFINTTNIDNTPVSVIEAMALGLPIISTNVGGMPYLIEHGVDGILLEPNNLDAFKLAVKHFINNEEVTKEMCIKARQKVEQFDWNIVKEKWKALLC